VTTDRHFNDNRPSMLLYLQHLLLVLALLFSQQVAFAHAQEHQLKGTASDQRACEQCALAAQLGSAPAAVAASFDNGLGFPVPEYSAGSVHTPGASAPFRSRAPPVSL